MIYTLSFIGLFLCLLALLWHFRANLLFLMPPSISSRLREYAPVSTFENALESGFSTSNFDLAQNVAADDRQGLDERSLTEIRRIMERERVGFDEGRRRWTREMFRKNGIDENGYPIDPKAITRLS